MRGRGRRVPRRCAPLRAALVAAVLAAPAAACAKGPLPPAIAGAWTAHQPVSVRLRAPRGRYRFVSDTVAIRLLLAADGEARGDVGGAVLENAYVLRGRGAIGRALHMGADFQLSGRLQGAVFAADSAPTLDVVAAFDLRGDTLAGTLFQKVAMGLVPMVELRLLHQRGP